MIAGRLESCTVVRETKKEFKSRVNICKTKDGSIIYGQNEVLAWWNEHFNDLLNKSNIHKYAAAEDGDTQSVEGPIAEEMNPPTLEELEKATKKLKNNKAPAADGITAELFKHGGIELKNQMLQLILCIWANEEPLMSGILE